ncbi:MAG: transglutaminase domain-containing protein [Xanthobacteraceae bacterium]|nr:transglutaminase domain-containing protein [Xanthobacteraceae bacterium]
MTLTRRDILTTGLIAAAGSALMSRTSLASVLFAPRPGAWNTYDVTTRIELPTHGGPAQAWIPVPSVTDANWVKIGDNTVTSNGNHAAWQAPHSGAKLIHATWSGAQPTGVIEITSRIALQDRATDLSRPGGARQLSDDEHHRYTASNDHIPLEGIVRQTSDRIVAASGASTPLEKARAIYDWMVLNTYREASVRGCGTGDVVALLQGGNLGGKCADLNALFVGLVRAQGIPARDVYGIRVAPSAFGYKSLGANSDNVTKAQHCRSEVFLAEFGWVAMDPADVRKVMLEESPGHLPLDNPMVQAARLTLLGSWEGNWMPYNTADLISLPEAKGGKPTFVMYPEAETVAGRLDCLDPQSFAYTITSKKV